MANTKGGENKGKSGSERGFAAMDPEKQKEIASKGGKASHESGNAHEFNSEEAREAGRKGGESRGNSGNRNSGRSSGGDDSNGNSNNGGR